jgi:hypothetical protein
MPNQRNRILFALGATLVVLFALLPCASPAQQAAGEESFGYLYCPECGLEMTSPSDHSRKKWPCPRCSRPGVFLEYSLERRGRAAGLSSFVGHLARGLVILGASLAALSLFLRIRAIRARAAEPTFAFACPACTREILFRQSQGGKKGVCPGCQTLCDYPNTKAGGATSKGGGLRRWANDMRRLPRRGKPPA